MNNKDYAASMAELEREIDELKAAKTHISKLIDQMGEAYMVRINELIDEIPKIKHGAIIEMVGVVADLGSNIMYAKEIEAYAANLLKQEKDT